MAATQLTFTLRTSSNVKTVHLLGSWDNYAGQLPLSHDRSKAGAWKGVFRFQSSTLPPGQRYWYYYIMDGYHVSHDPAKPSTQEPTTGRLLNILDVPMSGSSRNQPTIAVPTGRGISPSKIMHPIPTKHYASRNIREADYTLSPVDHVDDLAAQLEHASLYKRGAGYSPTSSLGSGSFRSERSSSGGSSPSSLTSLSDSSDSSCRCNRWGITRAGKKVLIDCGGRRCGYSDDSSSGCSSSSSGEGSDSEIENVPAQRYEKARPKSYIQEVEPRSAKVSHGKGRHK